ncbi:glycosyltransferase family 4 protein [[Clostridium] aminophilum]|nr:glycosyltransferase family 4 protein [[Clostridium] aminophilum]
MRNSFFCSFEELLIELERKNAFIWGGEIIQKYDARKKSILLISHELSLTGAPIVLINLARKLMEIGYQVILIAPKDTDFLDADHYELTDGVPIVTFRPLFESDFILRSADLFDVFIPNTICCAPIVRMLDHTDQNIVWWIHEPFSSYGRDSAELMPETVNDHVRVYAVGGYAKRGLEERYPKYPAEELIYYLPDISGGFSEKRVLAEHQKKKRVYAHIGAMGWRKGTDILCRAIRLLPVELIDSCLFVFAGAFHDDIPETEIDEIQKKYPESIVYTGILSPERVHQLYKEIDFLVCSSRDDPMPVVVAEGACDGVPCICSENTGSAYFIEKYQAGYVYNGNSPRRLAEKIRKSFEISEDEYRGLSSNARKLYEEVYSEEVFEKNVKRIIGFPDTEGSGKRRSNDYARNRRKREDKGVRNAETDESNLPAAQQYNNTGIISKKGNILERT